MPRATQTGTFPFLSPSATLAPYTPRAALASLGAASQWVLGGEEGDDGHLIGRAARA